MPFTSRLISILGSWFFLEGAEQNCVEGRRPPIYTHFSLIVPYLWNFRKFQLPRSQNVLWDVKNKENFLQKIKFFFYRSLKRPKGRLWFVIVKLKKKKPWSQLSSPKRGLKTRMRSKHESSGYTVSWTVVSNSSTMVLDIFPQED